MRLLITGASGELGAPLLRLARSRYPHVLGTTFTSEIAGAVQVDLRNAAATQAVVSAFEPRVIIHTALSDQSANYAEAIPQAGGVVAEAARAHGARLMALSTDMVFDGERPPYATDAARHPKNDYGAAKVAMEDTIREVMPAALIVRTSLIYDFHRGSRQVSWMTDALAEGEGISLFTDEMRQPIWVWDLARHLLRLAGEEQQGIMHIVGPERLSRYAYGMALLDAIGATGDIKGVQAAKVAPHRPRDLTLVNSVDDDLHTVEEAVALGPPDLNDDETMI